MNTRLICRLSRVFPESALPARHAARCPDCQEYFAASDSLDALLRAEAASASVQPPVGLERRLVAAVRASAGGHRDFYRQPLFSFGAVAAVAMLALGFIFFRSPSRDAGPAAPLLTAAETEQLASSVGAAGTRLWASLLSAGDLVEASPMNEELGLVYLNARDALRFLEKNFVPESFRGARPPGPRNG